MNDIKELLKIVKINARKLDSALTELGLVVDQDVSETFSVTKENGLVEFAEVNNRLDKWYLAGGLKKQVSMSTNRLYALLQAGVKLDEEDFRQIKANQDFYATSMSVISNTSDDILIADYHFMKPKYYNTVTGDRRWYAPSILDRGYPQWRVVNKQIVSKVKGVSTATMGNYSNPLHPEFNKKFFSQIPKAIFKKMDNELDRLHKEK